MSVGSAVRAKLAPEMISWLGCGVSGDERGRVAPGRQFLRKLRAGGPRARPAVSISSVRADGHGEAARVEAAAAVAERSQEGLGAAQNAVGGADLKVDVGAA